jgi:CubicO group peptidase (beta-lactamase class C family)
MRVRTIVIGLAVVALLAVLAVVFIPRLLNPEPEQVSIPTYWPTEGWRTSTPEEQGFDSAKLAVGLQDLQEGDVGINSLLIIRNGYMVLDAYFDPYNGSFPHKLASVTKSVTTTLLGIAIDQGKLQLDQPMVSFFTDRTIANLDNRKKAITVRLLAEMMNGMESGCLEGDEPTLDAMRSTPDWVQAALDRKMERVPGTRFCYDSPGMHLLSAILQKATGMTELEFARQNLFEPLGIQDVFWQPDPQGYTHGWGDLYLKPPDAAKLGYLWLNQGRWEDKQIVSASWLADMVKVHSNAGGDDYGYGIWIAQDKAPSDNYFAVGRGGQYIRVYPSFNAIIVVTAQGLEDFDELNPLLLSSFVSPDEPLPANPAGVTQLNATVTELAQAPQPYPVSSLPDTAKAISDKTLVFGPNPINVESLRFEFSDQAEATLHIMKPVVNEEIWTIGLDGKYRISPNGQAIRGHWTDPNTFILDVFEDGLVTYKFHFDGKRVQVSSPGLGLEFEGQIETP